MSLANLVEVKNHRAVTSSKQVAERFGKEHKNVLANIREILAAENSATKFFYENTFDNRGKQYPEYLMTRDGFSLLVMGFTGKEALQWKLKYIEAFNEMEKIIRTPQLTPNPHYRTRMVGTAIRDIGKTAEAMAKVFAVKPGMALAAAMDMIGNAYGIDTAPLRPLLPKEDKPGYMNPTAVGKKLGGIRPSTVNIMLESAGLQRKEGKEWRLTDEGRKHGEEKPYTSHGHSGYQIVWGDSVIEPLKLFIGKE